MRVRQEVRQEERKTERHKKQKEKEERKNIRSSSSLQVVFLSILSLSLSSSHRPFRHDFGVVAGP